MENSSWHLSDKVKDLHISTDAQLAGQVAQHYWYGVHKAKDKCNSFIYKTSKWGTAKGKCVSNNNLRHSAFVFTTCQCMCVQVIVLWHTSDSPSLNKCAVQCFSLWNDEQWHMGLWVFLLCVAKRFDLNAQKIVLVQLWAGNTQTLFFACMFVCFFAFYLIGCTYVFIDVCIK